VLTGLRLKGDRNPSDGIPSNTIETPGTHRRHSRIRRSVSNTEAFSNEKIIGSVSRIVCPHPDCRTSVAFVGTVEDEEGIHAGFHCKNGHRLNMGLTATEKGAELTITTSRQPIDARMVDLEKIWEDSEKRNSASNGR
jgi:hypothetical protein